jgi:hypothetical protein
MFYFCIAFADACSTAFLLERLSWQIHVWQMGCHYLAMTHGNRTMSYFLRPFVRICPIKRNQSRITQVRVL